MEKIELKQKALELHQAGYSYGEIAKQLNVPKSTVYRWINDPQTDYETPEMLTGTENETDSTDFDTNFGTNKPDYRGDRLIRNEYSSKIEIKKVELDHEFKMEELEFRKQQYFDKQKLEQKSEEVEKLKEKINEVIEEVDEIKEHNQKLVIQLESKTIADNKENRQKVIPKEIYLKINKIIKKYFVLDEKPCTKDMLNKQYRDAQEIRLDIYDWADQNKIALSDIKDLIYLNELIKEIGEAWGSIDEGSDEEFLLNFDQTLKRKMKNWIKEKIEKV